MEKRTSLSVSHRALFFCAAVANLFPISPPLLTHACEHGRRLE